MARDATNSEPIDHATSRSICDAVGERLQQDLRPQFLGPAPELDRLVDEFRRRERGNSGGGPPPGRRFGSFF